MPPVRVCAVNAAPIRPDRGYVLYWMIASRRTRASFALQHAVRRAQELGKPLLIFEALRVGYRGANDRLHAFVIDGMRDNAERCARAGVRYLAYVEPRPGAGRGLLAALAARACAVVTDEFPCFFLPRMVAAAGARLDVALEQVDGNGLLPLRATDRAFPTAHAFRRALQKTLPDHLGSRPVWDPLPAAARLGRAVVPRAALRSWPMLAAGTEPAVLAASLPIDHAVRPAPVRGGSHAGEAALLEFGANRLARYAAARNRPEDDATSGLSPYLHFGHVSAHSVLDCVALCERWDLGRISSRADGSREGWWGMGADAEAFLDQCVTWRELGYGFAFHRPHDYDRFESLPEWARATLLEHESDPRPHLYGLDELERARTHDPLWNAAQRQLVGEGRIHGYLRMLWGKKILEWTPGPRAALAAMIELNDRYALDGRDPNSYSGILWVLGRHDRPWGPRRPIFGTVRYMSSANTARKLPVTAYSARWAASAT